jgi:glyoxylate reductase
MRGFPVNKAKVVITKYFHPDVIAELENEFNLIIAEKQKKDLYIVLKENPDTVGLISFLSDKIDQNIIEAGPNLRIISNFAAGFNNIDIVFALKKHITVTNTPDILTDATADLTMALILSVCRKIIEADNFIRSDRFVGWQADLFMGKELRDANFGIVGLGRIGLAVAIRAKAFGVHLKYHSRHRKPEVEKKYGIEHCGFLDLLHTADIISLHLPYSEDVHHLFNADTFALMKKDAVFINTSRGGLMDEQALVERLIKFPSFSAGLDVYENEPLIFEKLKACSNTVLLPHIGSATQNTRLAMARTAALSIRDVLAGKKPAHPVN